MGYQRLISCLLLLQGERRRTARELAEALEVSPRTVYRDVEALSAAGVPIHMERGAGGGIVLADDYRRAIAQFTDDELQALFATAAGPLADLGLGSHASALAKLAGALPPSQRSAVQRGRDRLLLDHNRWYRSTQPAEIVTALRAAIAADRRVRLQYRDRSGAATDRTVDPLGLVAKAGVWYLVAHEAGKGYRTFRAERIGAVERLAETFARPADFDLDAYWQSAVTAMQRLPSDTCEVTLDVRAGVIEGLVNYWNGEVVAAGGERTTMRVRYPSFEMAVIDVISHGDSVSVIAPAELREAIVERARAVLAHHAAGAHATFGSPAAKIAATRRSCSASERQ
jgi:predicted DNA-binding transcriptional regulator YafY